ncbi:MAG: transposase [Chloroflexota bacterium]|nr:transposase [Chloroflexota bacterium]
MMKYPEELKREALNLAAQPGMKVAQVERDLGITPGLLYKWRQQGQPHPRKYIQLAAGRRLYGGA